MAKDNRLDLSIPFITRKKSKSLTLPLEAMAVGRATLEAVIETADFLPQWFAKVAALRGEAVCKVSASGTDFAGSTGQRWSGTGFLVSSNVLLTNHHVLNSVEVAREATVIFGYEQTSDGILRETTGYKLNPDRLFVTSPVTHGDSLGLDFTFVWVEGLPGETWGYIPLSRSGGEYRKDKPVNIIQHPEGQPKQLCVRNSVVTESQDFVLHYTTDTAGGSSGAPVCDDRWQLVALHHAAKSKEKNEGILLSAIATLLEQLAPSTSPYASSAREVLALFQGADAAAGFFGTLGRQRKGDSEGLERVVDAYRGEDEDLDIGFWNIEWFNRNVESKLDPVARIITAMNLDLWAFEETSPESVERLVKHLKDNFHIEFGFAHCEPDAASSKQSCSVIWNTTSVKRLDFEWPEAILPWFKVDSRNFGDLNLEAIHGKVFDRYPRPFRFRAIRGTGKADFTFCFVPVHLKAMDEGSLRRQQASKILAAAIDYVTKQGIEGDWIVGGDFNAELASNDFSALQQRGLVALSAQDEDAGAFSYVKSPKSLIDHIFVTADVTQQFGGSDYFIVAHDRRIADYTKTVSDHRPVALRLSLKKQLQEPAVTTLPETLADALRDLKLAD